MRLRRGEAWGTGVRSLTPQLLLLAFCAFLVVPYPCYPFHVAPIAPILALVSPAQLLLLLPNVLEHSLGGTAMLRAFMQNTHGRWKYVAPIPFLPFSMSTAYLVYGFFAYPLGFADVGPLSWEK